MRRAWRGPSISGSDMGAIRLLLVPAVAAVLTSPLAAQGAKAPMTISVTVVRSCSINSDGATVAVTCGRERPPVRLAEIASAPLPTARNAASGSAAPRIVTIDF